MSDAPWNELGLPPGSDRAAIRKRYAHRLRDVQHDPDAFQRLREAYEYCLAAVDRANDVAATGTATRPHEREDVGRSDHRFTDAAQDGHDEAFSCTAGVTADEIEHIAVGVLQRCTPLTFDPAELRAFVAGTHAFDRLGLRETVGLRIAERIVEGAAVTPHSIRELGTLFGWYDVVAQRHGILNHPVLQDRLNQQIVPHRPTGSHGRNQLPWIGIPCVTAIFAFDMRGDRPPHHVPTLPPWLLDVGPWLLVAVIAAFLLLEIRMMDYDPRSTSKPLTPGRRRNWWIARGVLGILLAVSAVATSRV